MGEDQNSNERRSKTSSKSKVSRLIERYELAGMGDELENHWTRESDDRMSLRDLVEYFNQALLSQALKQSDVSTLDGEVANYYRLLTADDVSRGTQIEIENRLEKNGIDVDQLQSDFVSRQAIHTYLTKERELVHNQSDQSEQERIDARIDSIRQLKNRLVAVTEQTISEFSQSGWLSSDDVRVIVLVQVHCSKCDRQYPITEFLKNGGCNC